MSGLVAGLAHLKAQDKKLAPLVDRYAPEVLPRRAPGFHSLSRIIVNQQLSSKAADTIFGRITSACQVDELTPDSVLNVEPHIFHGAGIAKSKAGFIFSLAKILSENPDFFKRVTELSDEDAYRFLREVKGIGPWTASIYLMSCDGRLNIFPFGDGSLNRAIKKLYRVDPAPNDKRFSTIANRWSPYKTIACRILWRWVDDGLGLQQKKKVIS